MTGGIEFHHIRFGAECGTTQNSASGQNDTRLEHRHVADIGVPHRKRPYDFAIQAF